MVACPRRYYVHGKIPLAAEAEFIRRLVWYFQGRGVSLFHARFAHGRVLLILENDVIRQESERSPCGALWAALAGKVLVYDYSPFALKLDALLHHKVFVINWERTFVTSAWRFCAAVADRPFACLAGAVFNPKSRDRSDSVLVVGNGPSAITAFDPVFSGMDVIVCNTAIKSRQLLQTRRVVAHCFIDAAFFLSPSEYSRQFLAALSQAAKNHDFDIHVDYEHIAFLRNHLPEVAPGRFFPTFIDGAVREQVNFSNGPVQTTNHSVSTTLMFPLAATHYRHVYLVGFDGKNPSMTNYFWKHSDEFQFNDLLPTVRACEPGFFAARDFAKHSESNDSETARVLSNIEAAGVTVISTQPSFIAPIQQRYSEAWRQRLDAAT